MLTKLFLELNLIDRMSSGVRAAASAVQGMGSAALEASRHFAAATSAAEQAFGEIRGSADTWLRPGVQAAADMESALARLTVAMPAKPAAQLADELERARQVADELAVVSPFSSGQVLDEAITELTKAGFSLDDVLGGGAKASALLATAEGSDIASANAAIVTLSSKMGLTGEELTRGADALVRYSGAARGSAAELGSGLSMVSGARERGLSTNETLALLALNANAGRLGSAGGTSVNAFLRELTTLKGATGGKVSAYSADGTTPRAFAEIVADLRTYFGAMTAEKRDAKAQKIFGDEGVGTLYALLETQGNSLEAVMAAAGESMGLDERVNIMSGGLLSNLDALGGTAEGTLARLFEPTLKPLTRLAQQANTAAGELGTLAATDKRVGQAVSGGAAALVGLGAVLSLGRAGQAGAGALRAMLGGAGPGSVAAGLAAGQVAEQLGAQSVFVVNWPAGMAAGVPGLPTTAAGAAGKLNGALGVAGAAAAGWGVGSAIDSALIGEGTRAEKLVQGVIGGVMNRMVGLFLSDETKEINHQALIEALTLLKDTLTGGVNANVQVSVNGGPSQSEGRR